MVSLQAIIDEFMHATSEEGTEMANRLAAEEGLLVGPSTGAACKVALEIAARPEAAGKNIVTIFPSSGIRYGECRRSAGVRSAIAS